MIKNGTIFKHMHFQAIARNWLLLTLCLVACSTGLADVKEPEQLTASKVFAEIPLEVLDMLRPSTRLDMLDYYSHADSILTVQDALGGSSRFEQVSPDYMKVSVTPASTLEIKILPIGKKNVVMTLYTVGSDFSESSNNTDTEVRFFDSNLSPLDPAKFLKAPTLKDFFNIRNSGLGEADLKEKIPFTSIVYTTGPGDAPLTAKFTTLNTLSKEDRDLLSPYLIPQLSALWKSSFKF